MLLLGSPHLNSPKGKLTHWIKDIGLFCQNHNYALNAGIMFNFETNANWEVPCINVMGVF